MEPEPAPLVLASAPGLSRQRDPPTGGCDEFWIGEPPGFERATAPFDPGGSRGQTSYEAPVCHVTQPRLFRNWCLWIGMDWMSAGGLDMTLVSFFTYQFQDGLRTTGGHTPAAIRHFLPTFGIEASARFPRAERALKGWSKLAPGTQRLPLPRAAALRRSQAG